MNSKNKNAIEEIANLKEKKTFSVGQDFVNNKLIYGVKFNNKNYILTSNKEFVSLENCEKELNIIPRHQSVEISNIRNTTILDFINGNESKYLKPDELFIKIKEYIKEYIYFENDKNYDVLSLWIFLSYCYKLFSYIPYLHLKGDKGVGKSSLLTILKNTCFNATMWSSMTEAVIFRYIDVSNATLLMDEAENLTNPHYKQLNCILNAGFNKEGIIPRTRMNKNIEKVIHYSAFSMKALAGINDIPNVLKDRCINIQMAKKPKNIKKSKYIDTSKKITEINELLVQNLYFFTLMYCKNIYNIYENMNVDMPECLSSRDSDIYLPLFCIAKFIDNFSNTTHIQDTLYQYSEEMSKLRNQQDIEENLSYKLITDLYYMITEKKVKPYKNNYYLNNDVFGYLKFDCDYNFSSTTGLTKALNTLQINHYRLTTNERKNTFYEISLNKILKLIDSYNITIPEITEL